MNYNKLTKKQLIELLEQHDRIGHELPIWPKIGEVYRQDDWLGIVIKVDEDEDDIVYVSLDVSSRSLEDFFDSDDVVGQCCKVGEFPESFASDLLLLTTTTKPF